LSSDWARVSWRPSIATPWWRRSAAITLVGSTGPGAPRPTPGGRSPSQAGDSNGSYERHRLV
jgi:hypothetical protein